jgi:NADH-quinone oxidoreductase subunit C
MAESEIIAKVETILPGKVLESHTQHGDETIIVSREDALEVFRQLQDSPELSFNFLMDVTAVDYLGREPRFEVVYHLYASRHRHRLRVKIRVPEEDPWVASVEGLWKSANWLEREVWDMFGIRFNGHSDLRRILMYEEFQGHPLRKDYPVDKRQPLTEERDPVETPWLKRR